MVAEAERSFAMDDPATGAATAHVANLGPADAECAIRGGAKAFPPW